MIKKCDFLIIGGGIIGLSIAREFKKTYTDSSVCLIEKENDLLLHASGRNSGVLHAGFYYSSESLKAQLTKTGNIEMREYCQSHQLHINQCGKLVVAKDENDFSSMDILLDRARQSEIDLYEISEKDAHQIEPRANTFERALFSPTTASVNPTKIMNSMKNDALCEGVKIYCNTKFLRRIKNNIISTSRGKFVASYIINAAGLYADKVAKQFGFLSRYVILPFKGMYLNSNDLPSSIRTNIHPVSDLKIHF